MIHALLKQKISKRIPLQVKSKMVECCHLAFLLEENMNDENIKYLSDKYESIIYRHEYKGQLMPFWFECGDGWFTIVDKLCANIMGHIEQQKSSLDFRKKRGEVVEDSEYEQIEVKVAQVKEKFGGLRFYIYGGDNYVRGMIRFAESMSFVTCEFCGKAGKLGGKGWYRTLCESCREDDERRKAEWDTNYNKAAEKVDAQNE